MADNRGVAYMKPGVVEVQSIDFPKLWDPAIKKKIEHGVILKIISTNICGSDQHMVRGRTTAPWKPVGKMSLSRVRSLILAIACSLLGNLSRLKSA